MGYVSALCQTHANIPNNSWTTFGYRNFKSQQKSLNWKECVQNFLNLTEKSDIMIKKA